MEMFCDQCEQASKGVGCTTIGVCGKEPATAALQDLLLYATEGISMFAHRADKLGLQDREIDVFTIEALFSTITAVNFDGERIKGMILRAAEMRDKARNMYEAACQNTGKIPEALRGPAAWRPASGLEALVQQGKNVSINARRDKAGDDVTSLQEILAYGLKGVAAYADHAQILGEEDNALYAGLHEGLDFLTRGDASVDQLVGMCLRAGELNLKAMELLDAANTGAYGHPVPTTVRITPLAGKAILISGHDLKDLDELLKQTEGKGINVYTHCEMLPAHGYPKLKAYRHLAGNYGGAWQDQLVEFEEFPGPILMTTNCIRRPRESYRDRLFTTGPVGWPGVKHISNRDFTPLIEAAMAMPGWTRDHPEKIVMVGFGREAVLGVADKVIEAVKSGAIKHFFLIGGCDGIKSERGYYTKLAQAVPQDTVILTLGCGRYRFNKLDHGNIDGIPRLLDIGQCNDAYSAIQIALALANAFSCGVNDLPLSLVLSWQEQKAIAILLSLLHLGIKDIRIGPSLPAFVSPNVLGVLVDNFGLKPISTPEEDLKAILG